MLCRQSSDVLPTFGHPADDTHVRWLPARDAQTGFPITRTASASPVSACQGAPVRPRRIRSLCIVGAGMALLHALAPDAATREAWLYLIALPIGYGHLLGGWLFARSRMRMTGLGAAFVLVSVLTLLCAYTWVLHLEALRFFVLVPMLLISGWHIVENDLALGRAYGEGMRLPPIPRGGMPHALALGVTALLGLVALATPDGAFYLTLYLGAPLPFQLTTVPDLVTAVLMYHAVSFVLFSLDRAKGMLRADARRLRRRLFWVHALPLAANAGLYFALPRVHFYLAAPTLYLFFSVLHAFQTAAVRGVEVRRPLRVAAEAAR